MTRLISAGLAVVLMASSSVGAARLVGHPETAGQTPTALNTLIERAFRAAYNLDHDEAMEHARRAVAAWPNESQAHRALASILWLNILFRRGAVSVDYYLGSLTRQRASSPKPPPELVAEFKTELSKAIELAEARLKQQPRDLQARYDVGSAYALQASYTASVEGSMTAAFRSARRAYDAQEEVLTRDPTRVGAGLVVGLYRYITSVLALPTRLLAYVVGFGGGKERGIQMLEDATADPTTRIDAKAALMLIYSREGRHREVVALARELRTEFPRNRLFLLEEGAASIRAGRSADAEEALTRGLQEFEKDTRVKVPGERAYWFYKRGMARVILRHLDAARADLHAAQGSVPAGWVDGRIHLELGKVADLHGRREEAVSEYRAARSICDANDDPVCANEASRLQRRPYEGPRVSFWRLKNTAPSHAAALSRQKDTRGRD
jgi:tetratricopeptide (TPR) repeat protein